MLNDLWIVIAYLQICRQALLLWRRTANKFKYLFGIVFFVISVIFYIEQDCGFGSYSIGLWIQIRILILDSDLAWCSNCILTLKHL